MRSPGRGKREEEEFWDLLGCKVGGEISSGGKVLSFISIRNIEIRREKAITDWELNSGEGGEATSEASREKG